MAVNKCRSIQLILSSDFALAMELCHHHLHFLTGFSSIFNHHGVIHVLACGYYFKNSSSQEVTTCTCRTWYSECFSVHNHFYKRTVIHKNTKVPSRISNYHVHNSIPLIRDTIMHDTQGCMWNTQMSAYTVFQSHSEYRKSWNFCRQKNSSLVASMKIKTDKNFITVNSWLFNNTKSL